MKSVICKNSQIHLIGIPVAYYSSVAKITTKYLKKIKDELRYYQRVDVVVIESQDFFVIPETGIDGSAVGNGCIEIKIDFSRTDVQKIVDVELPATLVHEFAHIVRKNILGYGDTLLDALVSEGLACYIEKLLFPRLVPYVEPILHENTVWKKAKNSLYSSDYDHAEWFFGTGALPRWIGYRLGYVLIEKYLKKNPTLIFKLAVVPSGNFIEHDKNDLKLLLK